MSQVCISNSLILLIDSLRSQEYLICKEGEWQEGTFGEYHHMAGSLALIEFKPHQSLLSLALSCPVSQTKKPTQRDEAAYLTHRISKWQNGFEIHSQLVPELMPFPLGLVASLRSSTFFQLPGGLIDEETQRKEQERERDGENQKEIVRVDQFG